MDLSAITSNRNRIEREVVAELLKHPSHENVIGTILSSSNPIEASQIAVAAAVGESRVYSIVAPLVRVGLLQRQSSGSAFSRSRYASSERLRPALEAALSVIQDPLPHRQRLKMIRRADRPFDPNDVPSQDELAEFCRNNAAAVMRFGRLAAQSPQVSGEPLCVVLFRAIAIGRMVRKAELVVAAGRQKRHCGSALKTMTRMGFLRSTARGYTIAPEIGAIYFFLSDSQNVISNL